MSVKVDPQVKSECEPSPRDREERLAERYCSLRAAGHSVVEALVLATHHAGACPQATERPANPAPSVGNGFGRVR